MPGWYSIWHIQLLTCQCFRITIGVIFMVTWIGRFLPMNLSQGARKLMWEYLLIQTMQEIKSPEDPELDKLSSWTMLQFLGCPRSKKLLKLQCLERNLLRWRLKWKQSGYFNTICAWWECQSRDRFYLWGQYVSYSQHTVTRVHIEVKVELKILPCD